MKLKFTALILAIALVFSGCSADIGLKIESNSKVVMTVLCDIEKEVYDLAMTMSGLSQQEIQAAMAEANLKIVTIDGKQYYEMNESESGTPKDIMSAFDDGETQCYISGDTFYLKFITADSSNGMFGDVSGQVGTISAIDPSSIKMTFIVEMPENIVYTTGNKDDANAKKVTFNVPTDSKVTSYTMFATTNSKVTVKSVQDLIKTSNKIAKPSIKSVKANKAKKKAKYATATVKIKKVKGAQRYYFEYSTNKKFAKGIKTVTSKKTTVKFKKLKKNKTYYVRVCAEKENHAGNIVVSKYSKVKKVKTKK